MKLVAVTACPTGIAHSQMAAESLEQTADREGHDIKVEIQGAMGAENELSSEDIAAADAAIIAADTSVNRDRFADVPVVKGTVKDGINDPESLIERAREAADEGTGGGTETTTAGTDTATEAKAEAAAADTSMKLVAVTACPTGIAHSQMAAESLEQTAKGAGHEIEVEIQGAMGAENELSSEDIAAADAVIIAADTAVNQDRFADVPVVKGTVKDGINDPESLIERAREAAGKGASEGVDTTTEAEGETTTGTDTPGAGRETGGGEDEPADGEAKRAVEAGQMDVDPDQVGGDPRKSLLARLRRLFS